ncbi:hypothetical protein HAX54_010402, partial [Datura stramonium]|nr:hypothetical protein [Datura stramonium]
TKDLKLENILDTEQCKGKKVRSSGHYSSYREGSCKLVFSYRPRRDSQDALDVGDKATSKVTSLMQARGLG